MWINSIFCSTAHARKFRLVNSGPLSQRTLPEASVRRSSHPTPESPSGWQNSCPLPTPGTPAYRHPPYSAPGSSARTPPHRTKSRAHSWFAAVRVTSGLPTRTQCFRFLRRSINPASRYIRSTRLWFTRSPQRPSKTCSRAIRALSPNLVHDLEHHALSGRPA
jgi:hypothetical protein